MTKNERFGFLSSVPGLITVIALMAYPVIYNFYTSFLRYDNVRTVKFIGFNNYKWFFSNSDSFISLKVSFIYSFGATTLAFLLALILAHSLNKIQKNSGLLRTLVILPWVAPLVISGLMWRWMLDKDLGIINYFFLTFG